MSTFSIGTNIVKFHLFLQSKQVKKEQNINKPQHDDFELGRKQLVYFDILDTHDHLFLVKLDRLQHRQQFE